MHSSKWFIIIICSKGVLHITVYLSLGYSNIRYSVILETTLTSLGIAQVIGYLYLENYNFL